MKPDELMEAIGRVPDDLLEQTGAARETDRPPRRLWRRGLAAVACLCVLAGAVGLYTRPWESPAPSVSVSSDPQGDILEGHTVSAKAVTLAKAVYPNHASYVDYEEDAEAHREWSKNRRAFVNQSKDYAEGMEGFYQATMEQLLVGKVGENRVYSPLSLYMALSMLTEVTGSDTRGQLLTLLGREDVSAVRQAAKGLWNANYQDDGYTASILGNSLWLDTDTLYVQDTLDVLADYYYASTFGGQMGAPAYTAALRQWINDQTGNLLKDPVANVDLPPETLLALVSTVYFREKWQKPFDAALTKSDVFHAATGEVTVEFMEEETPLCPVYFGKGYTAVQKYFYNDRSMWLLLPDEGVDLNGLIEQGTIPTDLQRWRNTVEPTYYDVTLTMPPFDVTATADLKTGLQNMGITHIFDSEKADFSPMIAQSEDVCLSEARHAARVKVDEEGCEAAAYTLELNGAGAPQVVGKLDFRLNRPFLFFITGTDGVLLFAGVVENP